MNKVQKRLKRARDLVANGWASGSYRMDVSDSDVWVFTASPVRFKNPGLQACFCATGAIMAAGLENPKDMAAQLFMDRLGSEAIVALGRAALEGYEYDGTHVTVWGALANWNDAPDRTHEEVLLAFDDAIAVAGEEA